MPGSVKLRKNHRRDNFFLSKNIARPVTALSFFSPFTHNRPGSAKFIAQYCGHANIKFTTALKKPA
jgi:hypothetical protein